MVNNDTDPPLEKGAQADCIRGRDKLVFWLNETLYSSLTLVAEARYSPGCRNASKCVPERKRLVREFGFWMKEYDNIGVLRRWKEPKKRSLCQPCLKCLEATHGAIRKQVWAKLPSFFGLPDWPVLGQ